MNNSQQLYVTIKGTLRCNLACAYCYGRDNSATTREMDDAEIKKSIQFVRDYAELKDVNSLIICWHGGEPLLLAERMPALLDYARTYFAERNIACRFITQTNAVLLTKRMFPLLRDYFDNEVGVSLDLYSDYRTTKSGQQSANLVIRNIDAAREAGIRMGCINLITQQNLHRIADIYQFYKERNMSVRLARVFPISPEDTEGPMYVSAEEFAEAQIAYFKLWASDPVPAKNSDIVSLICDLLLGKPSICFREEDCSLHYMALAPGGDIFTCAEFDAQEASIGNFLTQSAGEVIAANLRQRVASAAPVPDCCSECRYESICHGACLRERFMLKYPFRCVSNKIYWDYVVDWLETRGAGLYCLRGKSREQIMDTMNKIFGR